MPRVALGRSWTFSCQLLRPNGFLQLPFNRLFPSSCYWCQKKLLRLWLIFMIAKIDILSLTLLTSGIKFHFNCLKKRGWVAEWVSRLTISSLLLPSISMFRKRENMWKEGENVKRSGNFASNKEEKTESSTWEEFYIQFFFSLTCM